ncbi:MAG: T9SS type A sorting domain-containing protein [Lewinellaceae bacterium]|nr:T9SS type A sorting domain-containing protein [Lewinellaceae bacterium]
MKKCFPFVILFCCACLYTEAQTFLAETVDQSLVHHVSSSLRAGSCSSPDGAMNIGAISSINDPGCYSVNSSLGGGSVSVTYCFTLTAPSGSNEGMDFATFYSSDCSGVTWTNAVMYNYPSCTVLTNPAPLDVFNPGEFTPSGSYVFCYTMTKSGGPCTLSTFCPYYEVFSVMPIEITSIDAFEMSQYNEVHWSTSSELNNAWQVLEKSSNGFDQWTEVGRVEGSVNSQRVREYQLEDHSPYTSTFYRIKSIDLDGKIQYSDIVNLIRKKATQFAIEIMPNPFNDVLHISRIDLGGEVNIQISDMEGKIIFKEQINTNANLPNNKIEIFTENYLSGMYILVVQNEKQTVIKKVVRL